MSEFWSAVWVLGAYLSGSIPFGLLIGRLRGVDVRAVGSGNIGSTNTARAIGLPGGIAVFVLDFLKGFIPAALALGFFTPQASIIILLVGFMAIWGHMYPVFLRFKGGKGIATAAGAALALTPVELFILLAVFMGLVLLSRTISVGSLGIALAYPLLGAALGRPGLVLVYQTLVSLAIIYAHRANIRRLFAGKESRIGFKAEKEQKSQGGEPVS